MPTSQGATSTHETGTDTAAAAEAAVHADVGEGLKPGDARAAAVNATKEQELVVGPYQGGLGCLRIPYSRGVCGAAARTRETQLVPDVHAFPGHIACASR